MPIRNLNKQATTAGTAEVLEAMAADNYCAWIHFFLQSGATGPCRIGGPDTSITNKLGQELQPGATLQWPGNGSPGPYHTGRIYVDFAGNAAGADLLSCIIGT